MNVAIKPARQSGPEKADEGKREEVQRTESGEERAMMSQRCNPKRDEDNAENRD